MLPYSEFMTAIREEIAPAADKISARCNELFDKLTGFPRAKGGVWGTVNAASLATFHLNNAAGVIERLSVEHGVVGVPLYLQPPLPPEVVTLLRELSAYASTDFSDKASSLSPRQRVQLVQALHGQITKAIEIMKARGISERP